MVDIKTPDLCGASIDFGQLIRDLKDFISDLLANLESLASELAALISSGLNTLLAGLRDMLPELPDFVKYLQAEVASLFDMIPSSDEFFAKLAEILDDFGDFLAQLGTDLADLISGLLKNLFDGIGIDFCADVPNVTKDSNGDVTLSSSAAAQAIYDADYTTDDEDYVVPEEWVEVYKEHRVNLSNRTYNGRWGLSKEDILRGNPFPKPKVDSGLFENIRNGDLYSLWRYKLLGAIVSPDGTTALDDIVKYTAKAWPGLAAAVVDEVNAAGGIDELIHAAITKAGGRAYIDSLLGQ